MIAPHLFYMVFFAVCRDEIKVFFLVRLGPRIARARSGSTEIKEKYLLQSPHG